MVLAHGRINSAKDLKKLSKDSLKSLHLIFTFKTQKNPTILYDLLASIRPSNNPDHKDYREYENPYIKKDMDRHTGKRNCENHKR